MRSEGFNRAHRRFLKAVGTHDGGESTLVAISAEVDRLYMMSLLCHC